MHWVLEEVPWGNLWRTAATTALFFVAVSMPIAIFTEFDSHPMWWLGMQGIAVVAFVLASVVVWSERVRWIGDG